VIVLILVAMIVVVIRWVVRALKILFRGAGREAADLQARI